MIPLQISAHLLSRLAAVQDVLKLNSETELLHAFQLARAELSSTGPAPFDQFASLIPQDKRGDVLRGGRGRWTYDYVMQEIDHLIQMSSRMSPDMSSSVSASLPFPPAIPAKPGPIFSQTTAASPAGPAGPAGRSSWSRWLPDWTTSERQALRQQREREQALRQQREREHQALRQQREREHQALSIGFFGVR